MSGIIPDIASWALGGGVGRGEEDNSQTNAREESSSQTQPAAISGEDMRAKRMARLAAMEAQNSAASGNGSAANMDVDDSSSKASKPSVKETAQPMEVDSPTPSKPASDSTVDAAVEPAAKKKKAPPVDAKKKLRRTKVVMLRRVLQVTFGTEATDRAPSCVHLTLDDDEMYNPQKTPGGIEKRHVAEILAARLSLPPSSRSLETVPHQPSGLIAYLGGCHKRAGEEAKELRQSKKKDTSTLEALGEILEEITLQVVSYAASSLMVPDLFELASEAPMQLAKCLASTATDPINSITFDVQGKNTSFYACLCEELHSQDGLDTTIDAVTKCITESLVKCKSLVDDIPDGGLGTKALYLTSALREMCSNKKAAVVLSNNPAFLLPPANTAQAVQVVKVDPPYMAQPQAAMSIRISGVKRRSGLGLESQTILGLVLRLGVPSASPTVVSAFQAPARRSPSDIRSTQAGFRRTLETYQSKCNELVKALLVSSGADSRQKVIQWITDALVINSNAAGSHPDPRKISTYEFLFNLSAVMLKMCDPFISDQKKAALVDPGFVCSPDALRGVYAITGDDALPRLGENVSTDGVTYNPKNSFVPLCFFYCSRALALSIVPDANLYENTLRRLSSLHRHINARGGDVVADPRFNMFLASQHSQEIVMQSPGYVSDVFRYYNLAAGLFLNMPKEQLKTMPEHIIGDICSVLVYGAQFAEKLMAGLDFSNLFKLVVMLLSKDCASLVRNYNVRAELGDVLHDVFLPSNSSDRRRNVPDSVTCDPLQMGQPYLTSNKLALETLAPSLLLLYGEVEHTGYYEKMSYRVKIAALLKYLWECPAHKPAFKAIAGDEESFDTFANGIVNEMNTQYADAIKALVSIRSTQLLMANQQEWATRGEEEREQIEERYANDESQSRNMLALCTSVLKMLGFLSTDDDIRTMFTKPEMRQRLADMLLFVLQKIVGSRGLDLKVDNPESYGFRPKEMLQDLCAVFSSFASDDEFQKSCARSGYYSPELMQKALKTCRKQGLLVGESLDLFTLLAGKVEDAHKALADEEELYDGAPEEFMDPITQEWMESPVTLPSGNVTDLKTIKQHLLNDPHDPFNRSPLNLDQCVPAKELREKMKAWLEEKKKTKGSS